MTAFAQRELDKPMPTPVLNACYEQVRDKAVIARRLLTSIGIGRDGQRRTAEAAAALQIVRNFRLTLTSAHARVEGGVSERLTKRPPYRR